VGFEECDLRFEAIRHTEIIRVHAHDEVAGAPWDTAIQCFNQPAVALQPDLVHRDKGYPREAVDDGIEFRAELAVVNQHQLIGESGLARDAEE
jgi:hypothetical protein